MIFTENQQEIAEKIDSDVSKSNWKDWKWQIKHRITALNDVERLLELSFTEEKKAQIEILASHS